MQILIKEHKLTVAYWSLYIYYNHFYLKCYEWGFINLKLYLKLSLKLIKKIHLNFDIYAACFQCISMEFSECMSKFQSKMVIQIEIMRNKLLVDYWYFNFIKQLHLLNV